MGREEEFDFLFVIREFFFRIRKEIIWIVGWR